MKKIFHIVESAATGTLEVVILNANFQANGGHAVTVIYSKRKETPVDIESRFHSNVSLLYVPMSGLKFAISSIFKLAAIFNRSLPDVVVLHSSFAGFVGRLAGIISRQKASFFYIPHCISFMRQDISSVKRFVFVLFEMLAGVKSCTYLACSNSEYDQIRKYLPFSKCEVVENAVKDSDFASFSNKGVEQRRFTIVTVGQIRPQKSPSDFSTICKFVREKNDCIDFVWVGDGDEYLKRQLIDSGVVVTGWCDKKSVFRHIRDANIYLSTSRWEGMPISIIESMFLGTPVLASRCFGNTDVVEHMKTGFLFDKTSQASDFILSQFADSRLIDFFSDNSLVLAGQRFSVERYMKDMSSKIGI